MTMNQNAQLNIFFEEKQQTTVMQNQDKSVELPESIPYMGRGDSNLYLDQFLVKEESPEPEPLLKVDPTPKKDEPYSASKDEDFQLQDTSKFNPSAFHNFQKHLTVCLKHSISFPSEDKAGRDYQIVAGKLWKAFKNSNVSTKKILHYLLGQRNEHKITEQGLKEYGFGKIYEIYGEKVGVEARRFLASETLRQIREGRLEAYISAKRLKDKEKFRKYVEIFVGELQSGYLRKRLPKDKVNELLQP